MTQFLQAIANGLALAAVYSLIALGFVIVYKSTQVFNFAQPALVVLGAYFVVYFADTRIWGLNFWLALLIGGLIAVGIGVSLERGVLRPMIGKPVFAVAIITIGINTVLTVVAFDLLGNDIRPLHHPWRVTDPTQLGANILEIGSVRLAHADVAGIVFAVVLVGVLLAFFRYSRHGLAMRATAFDQEVALTQGVSVSTVFALSWAIAAVLAMVAGVFISAEVGLTQSAPALALKALAVVVVGGLDSISGALVGALLVAVAEMLTATYQPQHAEFLGRGFSQVVPYLVMFVVLLVRPYGLFGTKEVERV